MTAPLLTVVIPSVNGLGDLIGCLEHVLAQREVSPEILVMDRCGPALRAEVAKRFPTVRVVAAEADATIPDLRASAFALARGDFVAVIEDHVIVPPTWARDLLAAQREAGGIVGGAVENAATERLVDWAAFLCEYSHCLPPIPAGRTTSVTGNNVIYPRELLERHRDQLGGGRWENHLHDALLRDGVPLTCRPEIVVGHKKHYTVTEYLTQRYLYARSYAGARLAGAPLSRRVMFAAASFALPPVLFYRTVARVLTKRRHRGQLVRSLPLLALFVSSWAWGEVVGSAAGAGDSLSRVT